MKNVVLYLLILKFKGIKKKLILNTFAVIETSQNSALSTVEMEKNLENTVLDKHCLVAVRLAEQMKSQCLESED